MRPVPERSAPGTSAARAWALRRLQDPITLGQLAARESMSVRHFTRRFRDEVGLTPMNWLIHQRIELARELLEESDVPVEQVAARAGLGTAANLRHFHAALGVSPSAYRTTFRGRMDRGEPRKAEAPVRTGRPSGRAGSTSTAGW